MSNDGSFRYEGIIPMETEQEKIKRIQNFWFIGIYSRDSVLSLVEEINDLFNKKLIPKSYLKEITVLALLQQMSCVTENNIKEWMTLYYKFYNKYQDFLMMQKQNKEIEERLFEDL